MKTLTNLHADPKPSDKNYFLLGFFEKDDDLKIEFMKAAGELREKYKFAHTQSEEVIILLKEA